MAEDRRFSGMLGSIDCMHWQWKNCPKAWKGMYMSGYRGVATIVLEVVASSDLWIWHVFFGVSGSNNDINMLDRSPVFNDILNDRASDINFTINGNNYTMGYYLADDIYPEWATFVKSISKSQGGETQVIYTIPRRAKERCRVSIRSVASTLCNYTWSSTFLGNEETCKHNASLYYIA
ncbi:uncharacterized protein LOC107464998 [Arachis duranensis]|uniref:Uncharacterized protein LOC107464998 n=1 Tax=Arachis duranensis TaxID=130453 RepID=A0A6P4BL34_ARADU|nr:uncharacterized protein LOC107464998 [Arachis duranensis]